MTKILYQEDERKETRENEDREIQKKEVQNRRNLWEKEEVRYDTREHDWIAEQEMGSLIMEETENLWTLQGVSLENTRSHAGVNGMIFILKRKNYRYNYGWNCKRNFDFYM